MPGRSHIAPWIAPTALAAGVMSSVMVMASLMPPSDARPAGPAPDMAQVGAPRSAPAGVPRPAPVAASRPVSSGGPVEATLPPPRPTIPAGEVVHGAIGARIDAFLSELSQEKGFAGAVLVAHRDTLFLKKGYGLADREQETEVGPDTLFDVGPLSMMFTAAAVLKLASEKRVDLDAPVRRYVPGLTKKRGRVTLHQILIHTSGIVSSKERLAHGSREEFIGSLREAPVAAPPGDEFEYSNAGYTLLAAVVEEVAGMSFDDYLAREIFSPAGMVSTGYIWSAPAGQLATGYEGQTRKGQVRHPHTEDYWGVRGTAGIGSNVADLYRWVLALERGTVIPSALRERMFTPHVGNEGYGWHVIDGSNLGRLVRRGSALPAFESSIRWYRDEQLAIVFAINSNMGHRIHVARGIARILAPHFEARDDR